MSDSKNKTESASREQDGLSDSINPRGLERLKNRKKKLTVDDYVEGIREGNRTILSRAITLIESSRSKHREQAEEIIEECLPHTGNSIRVGITGVPGVGKSTFIEMLGNHIIDKKQRKLAVLAIDPSSTKTKGSILGDKTRMETLANNEHAYIRPSPTAGSLGGVARKTRETIYLCEAAGYDTIFIETVGVGQSETAVHSMVDFFLLLMLAGAGDELQGIKRGIMEMADAIAINKIDSSDPIQVKQAVREYKNALHLYPEPESGWGPQVTTCSATTGKGIEEIWEMIEEYISQTKENGFFRDKRNRQSRNWMYETIQNRLSDEFYSDSRVKQMLERVEQNVLNGEISPFKAANILLDQFRQV
ncbi:methylmalonyl Co-A mutase-associated GTPase MeaB [Halalkalibaculum sp. DA3122]|uniref:methylmalonyl Co-A mutase-associated GTPase MeaB n=1 Tax=Halalkalibaculum sp. DA3122 TaxID=3373607 RepID=UPI0037547FF8